MVSELKFKEDNMGLGRYKWYQSYALNLVMSGITNGIRAML